MVREAPRATRALAAACAAALAILAGCRTAPPALPESAPWEIRRPQLQAREHFELKGRVAVATGTEGFNANLRWRQDGVRSQLTLEGPLGVGGAQITTSGDELTLVTSKGERVDSTAAHAELVARLGFDPPLDQLRYWVQGVPDPAQPSSETLDPAQQRLAALTQDGWHIDYLGYTAAGGEILPSRLTMQRESVRLRLVVDDWKR